MSLKRCFPLLLLAFFALLPLDAATVSFIIIETGLDMEADANQNSSLWENGLFDVFFDSGHIVSNAPLLRLGRLPKDDFPAEALNELDEAIEGGVDFFIVTLLEFPDSGRASSLKPRQITLRLFRVQPLELLHEQIYPGIRAGRNDRDEFDNLKQAARSLVPHIR